MSIGELHTRRLPPGAVLIVGAGLAGLYMALKLAPQAGVAGRPVFVLTSQRSKTGAASAWAQGGIAAALDPDDHWQEHASDTIAAGDGLVDIERAEILAREGPERVRDLLSLGVPFDQDETGNFLLGLEAAHSRARVAKVKGDTAGQHIVSTLMRRVRASEHITGLIGWRAESLLTDRNGGICGALARRDDGSLLGIEADTTVLATGGIGGLFAVTTNPRTARGDALGMAAVLGAQMRDMEFVQFHPTAIDVGRDPAPLATEALRGHGATLINADGRRFMPDYHPDAELAPRDDVARAIFAEIQSGRAPFLDARQAVGGHFPDEFPTVFKACQAAGIDPRTQPIPVAPAVHYHMGGIATDAHGRTNLEGLFAIGECAASGVHGANRLASNSLLEAVVFGGRAAQHILNHDSPSRHAVTIRSQPWLSMTSEVTRTLRAAMTEHCGVRRNAPGLNILLTIIDELIDHVGFANPLVAARMIASCALAREESRGGHFRDDHPLNSATARSSRMVWSDLL